MQLLGLVNEDEYLDRLRGAIPTLVETELRQMLERTSEMGPEMREFMARMSSPRNLMLLMAASTLVMYPVFGMLGALLGTVFFRKKSPPTPA